MFFKIRPTDQKIRSLRDARKELSFSYADVGATRMTPPSGWRINHMRSLLGRGRVVHDKAVNALFSWELLTVGSLEVFATAPGVVPQADVAILSRHFGIWSVDFCRVIYVLNEEPENGGAMLRTGFGYGTLPGHAVRGEEIFSIERILQHRKSGTTSIPSPCPRILCSACSLPLRSPRKDASRARRSKRPYGWRPSPPSNIRHGASAAEASDHSLRRRGHPVVPQGHGGMA
jgi:uncharacterized protein (UPF0548 family)